MLFRSILVPIALMVWFGFSRQEEVRRLGAIFFFFIGAFVFWALFEQAGSSLSLFADRFTATHVGGVEVPSSWYAAANPIFVITLAPLFALIWTRLGDRQPSSPMKFTLGLFFLALGFSPTDATLATASADRSLKVWSTKDGRLLRTFAQHTEAIHALAFKPRPPKHNTAAPAACITGGDDRTVRLWQPEIGRMVRIIRQHQGPVFALAWLPDGSACFSAGKEGIIRRLDAGSDTIEAAWHDHADWIHALAVSPDGQTLASGDWSGQVRLRTLR